MGFLKCVIYLAAIGVLSFLLGRLLPEQLFHADRYPFRSFSWEKNGAIYKKLKIHKWQNKVPDMSRIFPKLIHPKRVDGAILQDLPILIHETCVAEFIHLLLCAAGLYCLKLWPGMGGVLLTLVYIIIGNVPYILIQRYNRPRFCKLQAKHACSHTNKEERKNGNIDLELQYRSGT